LSGSIGYPHPGNSSNKLSILVVGDQPQDTLSIVSVLEGFDIDDSFVLSRVHTVRGAFENIVNKSPDVIIVTVTGITSAGIDVLQNIRNFAKSRISGFPRSLRW
jgi:CheY-like chemotaxis protein